MQCIICGAEAQDLTSGDFAGLIVRCKHCGEYEVADGTLDELLRLDYDRRVAALASARDAASSGARPSVTPASLPAV